MLFMAVAPPVEDRVSISYAEKGPVVRELCAKAGLRFPPKKVFFRAFKRERTLELWGSNGGSAAFKLIHAYPVAAASGELGPKRIEGDRQVPEGFYKVDRFNPRSQFWLSLGLDYPNRSDRILSDQAKPGGDIFIHGNCVSIGCLAMTDDAIKEIYILANEAKKAGQKEIAVHILPFRMTKAALREAVKTYPQWTQFWNDLLPGYQAFESTHRPPKVDVLSDGRYRVQP